MKRLFLGLCLLYTTYLNATIEQPEGSLYMEGDKSSAVLMLTNKKQRVAEKVIDTLLKDINKQLGLHTLLLKMPSFGKNYKEYGDYFPEAYIGIEQAIQFLHEKKQIKNIYLFGYDIESTLASAFVAKNPNNLVKGLIIVGCRNNGDRVLSCSHNIRMINIPILDVCGMNSEVDNDAAIQREKFISPTYTQIKVDGADHIFDNYCNQLTGIIIQWLKNEMK